MKAFSMARETGFSNINVDLVCGFPGRSLVSWEDSLYKRAQLKPEHISAYSLIIEEGTPFASQKLELPDEEEERNMYERTREILGELGVPSVLKYRNYPRAQGGNAGIIWGTGGGRSMLVWGLEALHW